MARLPDLGAVLETLAGWCLIVDTETTGLDPETDRVISLAMMPARVCDVRVLQGPPPESPVRTVVCLPYVRRFRVDRPSTPEALVVHGITTEDLAAAGEHPFGEYSRDIEDLLLGQGWGTADAEFDLPEPPALIAHNAPCDIAFLDMEFARVGREGALPRRVIDTRVFSKILWLTESGSRDALAGRPGVDIKAFRGEHHTARGDVELLAACLAPLVLEIRRRLAR